MILLQSSFLEIVIVSWVYNYVVSAMQPTLIFHSPDLEPYLSEPDENRLCITVIYYRGALCRNLKFSVAL